MKSYTWDDDVEAEVVILEPFKDAKPLDPLRVPRSRYTVTFS
jgi:hypothetical protein